MSTLPTTAYARPALLERAVVALVALLVLLLLGLAGCGRRVVPIGGAAQSDAIPGLIDVGLEGFTAEHHTLAARLGEVIEDEKLTDDPLDDVDDPEELLVIRVDPAREAAILDELRGRPDVHFAEPVFRVEALWVPDDPQFAQQWHLKAAGAPAAWDSARGAGVTVAVIDTGIAPVDDLDPARLVRGHNFLTGGDDATDDHGHGTHVAGTVAQTTDNGVGVAGMAPLARLMPLKVLGADGSGTSVGIADAIRWAADHGARVLNLSLGGGSRSAAMAHAVAYARSRGCVVVCAAGNGGGRGVSYPAAYRGAIAVSAVGPQGRLAPYSSYGPEVRIAAPGGDKSQGEEAGVLQETIDPSSGEGVYRWFQGTSMAAPHVSGAAALLESAGVTSPGAVERLLASSARAPGAYGNVEVSADRDQYGAGLLDVARALRTATVWWTLWRVALAAIGALFALRHARALGQIRKVPPGLWPALLAGAGAYALLVPLGAARVGLGVLALPPAGLGQQFFGLAGSTFTASALAYLGWSGLPPFLVALFARSAAPLRGIAAGLAFGWAGVLLHAALVRSVYLPLLPSWLVVAWLLAGAVFAWWTGRAVIVPERIR
ncbi:MAG TPA: S8 family peptidase [Myxococcales bacterium]|nr:S8 family peptidase [Myxococcales bacterium]